MRTTIIAVIAAAFLAGTASAGQDIKIGYVDLQKALNESEAGKRARADFRKEVEKLQEGLKKQKEEIDAMKEELEKKSLVLKDDERRDLELRYKKRMRDFERAYKDSQGDLQLKDNQLTAVILKDLNILIQKYGKREGYTLILENSSSTVLYGAGDADLTDRIIAEYNKEKNR